MVIKNATTRRIIIHTLGMTKILELPHTTQK